MAGLLKKLFKPKWQHKSEDVRDAAVQQLSENDPEQLQTLIKVVTTDASDRVRNSACVQLNNLGIIIELTQHQDKTTQRIAKLRLESILSLENMSLWPTSEQQLADLVISLPNLPTIPELLAKIQSQPILAQVAEQARVTSVRQQAAQAITEEPVLEGLEKALKGKDKGSQKIIKEKLAVIQTERQKQQAQQEEVNQAIASAEQQAKLPFQPLCEAKLETLNSRWDKIKANASEAQSAAFLAAITQCKEVIAEHYQAESEAKAEAEAHKDAREEQEATVELLEREQDQIVEQGDFNSPALNALLKTQDNRWQDSCETTRPAKALANRFQRVRNSLTQFIQAHDNLEEHKARIEELLADETPNIAELKQLIHAIHWPSELNEPELLTQVLNIFGDVQKEQRRVRSNLKQDSKTSEELLDKAEAMLADGKLKGIFQNIRQAQDIMKNWPNERKINKRIRQLQYKFKEMKDWQDYAVLPKLESLCERMESLVDADVPLDNLASQLKQARNDWKELGYSDNNYGQALWHRFKDASDKVNERCKPHFESISQLRADNLQRRKDIITQLTEFVAKVDWNKTDWKVIDQLYKQSIEEWKNCTPVNRSDVEKIQKDFDTPLHTLKDKLKEERDNNTAIKQTLLDEAKTLLDEENLKKATDQAKDLQKKWQQVGVCHRRQEQHLWKDFRAVCDQLFGKRSEQWQEQKEQRDGNLVKAKEIITQIQQLAESDVSSSKELSNQLRELQTSYGNIGSIPKEHFDGLETEYRAASDAIKQKMSELKRAQKAKQGEALFTKLKIYHATGTQQLSHDDGAEQWQAISVDDKKLGKLLESAWSNLLSGKSALTPVSEDKLRELCIRSEIVADKPSPESDQSLRMSLQVERLSKGMNNGEENKETSTSLLSEWLSLEVPEQSFNEYLNRLLVALEYK
ncbi:DUF349 domain-containing protein [Litoribacillus peritrichatus]|uniref:DUF349 domain-containing protein n=1 Tax=Litoribacillus peritrichatus TaxID=718191 RepID=A0ABP7N7A4_9GAMM